MLRRCLIVLAIAAGTSVVFAPTAFAGPPSGPYASCTQAAEYGDYNIPKSSPHYSPDLDRDGDGIACEKD